MKNKTTIIAGILISSAVSMPSMSRDIKMTAYASVTGVSKPDAGSNTSNASNTLNASNVSNALNASNSSDTKNSSNTSNTSNTSVKDNGAVGTAEKDSKYYTAEPLSVPVNEKFYENLKKEADEAAKKMGSGKSGRDMKGFGYTFNDYYGGKGAQVTYYFTGDGKNNGIRVFLFSKPFSDLGSEEGKRLLKDTVLPITGEYGFSEADVVKITENAIKSVRTGKESEEIITDEDELSEVSIKGKIYQKTPVIEVRVREIEPSGKDNKDISEFIREKLGEPNEYTGESVYSMDGGSDFIMGYSVFPDRPEDYTGITWVYSLREDDEDSMDKINKFIDVLPSDLGADRKRLKKDIEKILSGEEVEEYKEPIPDNSVSNTSNSSNTSNTSKPEKETVTEEPAEDFEDEEMTEEEPKSEYVLKAGNGRLFFKFTEDGAYEIKVRFIRSESTGKAVVMP